MTRSTDRRRRKTGAPFCCVLASIAPFTAASAAWDTVPDIRMGVEANDNPRLGQYEQENQQIAAQEDHTALRALMDARFRLSNSGPRGGVLLQPRISADAYSDPVDSDLETKDFYLNARGNYRWQRTEAGVRGNFSQESIFSSEILDTGINDLGDQGDIQPIETDTGELTLLDEHRNRTIISPYANFSLSQRSSIGIDATFLGVTYSGPQFLGRSDITQKAFNTSVTRTIDTRTSASARVFVSNFHAKINDNDTHTVGVEGSIARKLSSIWSFNLATGLERSSFNFVDPNGPAVENAAANFTLDLGFVKHTEIADLSFDLRRSADPSAAGFLTERNELQILYRREISQRLTASFAVRAFQTRSLDHSERVSERNFARGAFEIDWAFTPTWSFNVAYDSVSQTFLGERRQNGHANLLSFGVVYRGLARR